MLTPFWVLYAMHDALVKPMPGSLMAPSLAESWTVSPDSRTYEFKLREGLKFHNGDPFTAEDVKFSFQRAKGARSSTRRCGTSRSSAPYRVRFHLHEPWPDFMTFYGTFATGAGWIVPKKYMEQVGATASRSTRRPRALQVREPHPGRRARDGGQRELLAQDALGEAAGLQERAGGTTRAAMLKRGEVDLAYLLDAPQAQEVKRDPDFKLAFSGGIGTFFLDFLDQWDPKSPWHDRRVRLAASHAIDRKALSEAETLGASRPTGSIVPRNFEFALPLEPHPYDPARAKQLLAEAGYPNGFDAGDLHPWPPYFSMGEAIGSYLGAVGHQDEDADHGARRLLLGAGQKKIHGLCVCINAVYGNAASRHVGDGAQHGAYAYGGLARHRRALQAAGRARPTAASGRPCCTRSSGRSTSGSASRRSWTTSGRAASGRGWRSRP